MSYLLDALKQSQDADMSAQQYDLLAQQAKQQQQVVFYRRLSFLLAGGGLASLIMIGGFSFGKWLQHSNEVTLSEQVVHQLNNVRPSIAGKNNQSEEVLLLDKNQNNEPIQPTVTAPNNTPIVAGQLVYVQTPSGLQQMVLTPQGEYLQTFSNLSEQNNKAQVNNATPITPNSLLQTDLSKYKVLGKPLAEQQGSSSPSVQQTELEAVPQTLKNAFAQAIQATEFLDEHEVTQGSYNSSRVQPVELLPDGLQSMLPTIKYQAHIYASTPDKKWIKLNGKELYEGESIGVLKVVEITPEQSILNFDGYQFSLKALQDWPQ